MKPRLKSTRAARDLIKAHEPFLGKAEPRGRRFVVGYGHTAAARPGVRVQPEDAELLLIYDVLQAEQAVHAAVGAELAAPVRDALVSFAASVGINAFKVSDVARLAKAGKHREAAAALETWVRAEEDGRLVVSERLTRRRAAEKALYLQALDPQPAPAAEPEPPADEPRLGPLIELDIAFEDADAAPEADAPGDADEDAAEAQSPPAAPEAESASEDAPEDAPEDAAEDAPDAVAEDVPAAPAEPSGETPVEDASVEETPVESQPPAEAPVDEPTAAAAEEGGEDAEASAESKSEVPAKVGEAADAAKASAESVKAAQDAAIRAVMTRMAGELASSVAAAPERDLSDARLGFSYLSPAAAAVGTDDAEIVADTVADAAPPSDDAPAAPTPDAAPAPGPVYAAVAAAPAQPSEAEPPHPADAPASAPGLSGEIEGPDRDDGEDAEPVEEDEELAPELVAGREARAVEPEQGKVRSASGNWVFMANLVIGLVLIALGGWDLLANLDAYLAYGFSYGWLGPVVFGSGVLLSAASGWLVVSRSIARRQRAP